MAQTVTVAPALSPNRESEPTVVDWVDRETDLDNSGSVAWMSDNSDTGLLGPLVLDNPAILDVSGLGRELSAAEHTSVRWVVDNWVDREIDLDNSGFVARAVDNSDTGGLLCPLVLDNPVILDVLGLEGELSAAEHTSERRVVDWSG